MPSLESFGPYSQACKDAFDLINLSTEAVQRILDVPYISSSFTPIGEIALGGNDTLVYAGLKTRTFDTRRRVAEELYVGDVLLNHCPERVSSLPIFTLPAVNQKGRKLGILTEDFTQDGTHELKEHRVWFPPRGIDKEDVPEGLYTDVYKAFDGCVYSEAFGHMLGTIGSTEVMIDFNEIAYPSSKKLEKYEEFVETITLTVTL